MRAGFVVGTLSPSSGGGSTSQLYHGQTFTLIGTGYGSKSRSLTPLVRDLGTTAQGTVDAQWTRGAPASSNPTYTTYNMQNRATTYNPAGSNVGPPHPFVSGIYASAHFGDSAPWEGFLAKVLTAPTFPICLYASWLEVVDPAWNYSGAPGNWNIKQFAYGAQTGIQDCIYLGMSPALTDNTRTTIQVTTNDNNGTVSTLENPDRNGHTPTNVGFWASGIANPFYVSSGHGAYRRVSVSMCLSPTTGPSGVGYWNVWVNGTQAVNYAGRTDNYSSIATNRGVTIGPTVYSGENGTTITQNNVGYMADLTLDISAAGVTGNVAHVVFCDQPTFAASTVFSDPISYSNWSAANITGVFNEGQFAVGQTVYATVFTESGAVLDNQPPGPFTVTAVFDFYISTTGSDSNPGTLASPWAITSLLPGSSHRAAMAGKRIGVLPGTYNVIAAAGGSTANNFSAPVLDVPPGTISAQTVVQSTTPLGAILDGGFTNANAPNTPPVIGHVNPGDGYYTIDGFEVRNTNDRLISVGGGTGAGSAPDSLGVIVQNCYVHKVSSTSSGANSSGITAYALTGGIIQNNFVTAIVNSNSRNSGIETWSCVSTSTLNNTIIMNNAGASAFYIKNAGQKNNTFAYNYVDCSAASSLGGSGACAVDLAGTASDQTSFHHNVILARQCFDSSGIVGSATTRPEKQLIYNNTFIIGGGGAQPILGCRTVGQGSVATFYNNLCIGSASGYGQFAAATGSPILSDYNLIQGTLQLELSANGSSWTTYSTLGAWQAALSGTIGKDTHTLLATALFVSGTPTLPAQAYQLQAGSPGKGTGSSDGTSTGSACDMGAWGNGATAIGCNFAATANV